MNAKLEMVVVIKTVPMNQAFTDALVLMDMNKV